jgi:hypothetical protein
MVGQPSGGQDGGGRETSIGEAFGRVAERFGRLVVQHVTLVRTELEGEARAVAQRLRSGSELVGRAAPFIVAGCVLASFGGAEALAVALAGLLGKWARATAFGAVGAGEAAVATAWLVRALRRVADEPRGTSTGQSAGGTKPEAGEEKTYGAVGRA